MLQQCIRLLKIQTISCDILIINNASSDGTAQWLESQHGFYYQNMDSNLGGAGGFNRGIRWAVESGYKYVWVMDDDTLPYPNALEKLLDADKLLKGKYGWLSSVALWTDGTDCKMNRQKIINKTFEYRHLLKHGLVPAEQATFVSLFLRTSVIRRVGLPIKEFFIWGDDIEYTRRIAVREKIPSFIAEESRVIHAMEENNGSNIATDNPERLYRYRYAFRNEAFLYRREGLKGICYYVMKCAKNLLCILVEDNGLKSERCSILFASIISGVFFNPIIETFMENKKDSC